MTETGAPPRRFYTADWGWVTQAGKAELQPRPYIEVAADGTIVAIESRPPPPGTSIVRDLGPVLILPGFVNAHSHAFQRLIRGATGRRASTDPSSFWSWRSAMYEAAASLDPEALFGATCACYREMLRAGITCVGEFHYIHHQRNGHRYDNPNELGQCIISAAADTGIRLTLLEVYYSRAGHNLAALPEQLRFCDGSVPAYLARIDRLRELAEHGAFTLGLAPHSVRATTAEELGELSVYARQHDLVVHAHVSEQPLENAQCHAEYGKSPTQVFADAGMLLRPRSFTAVHAVHINADDRRLLADQSVCACPTTEADLGDGIVPASDLLACGVNLCLGTDSNAVIDLVQEARLLEMGERLRLGQRLCLQGADGRVAPILLAAATTGGATSLGRRDLGQLAVAAPFDAVCFDLQHVSLVDVPRPWVCDSLMLHGSAAAVTQVYVGGEQRV
ncbi:MAG: formimidoylglutamate deiminase [Nannocystaceae bacterium]